ncbi:MAG TPA: hypothetical protein VMW87_02415 [Spirochaetia bacterium]|nr:hypothetical protein [Spirochaetia bacterium]
MANEKLNRINRAAVLSAYHLLTALHNGMYHTPTHKGEHSETGFLILGRVRERLVAEHLELRAAS